MTAPAILQIDGKDYVVLPKADYVRLTNAAGPDGLQDAHAFVRASIAADLRKAREQAGLSQSALAKKLAVTQPMVSATEAGRTRVSEKYVRRVLKACKLPPDWVPPP